MTNCNHAIVHPGTDVCPLCEAYSYIARVARRANQATDRAIKAEDRIQALAAEFNEYRAKWGPEPSQAVVIPLTGDPLADSH